ncbi:hypothetical protein H5410_003116 [Solanum commersonii]|uniref:Uncharacterized protein n=1 Tax=Solanum commersonii TaxID=4109 RepID=A0A9J6B4S6_SOLCO|nr:hypothetical protein H5410_003116 [Solanum commersonii]
MNVHDKTQTIYESINCVLKDSSCDTPLSKILKLVLLASNASSSSTKAFECPHTNDDSIFTHKCIINLRFRIDTTPFLQRGTQCILSPIGLPLFFWSTLLSALSRSKRKVRLKGCSREIHTLTMEVTREIYVKLAHTLQKLPKIISRAHLTKSIRLTGQILGLFMHGSK